MSQVTNVTVAYDRKRQPAQYESAGASVTFAATVGDNEDPNTVAAALLGQAKTIVLTELGIVKPGENASASARAATTAAAQEGQGGPQTANAVAGSDAKATRTRAGKKGQEATAEAGKTAAPPPGGPGENRIGPDDLPEDHGQPAQTASTAASKGTADLPDEKPAATATTAPKATLTAQDVQKEVASAIKEKRIDVATVKSISREFGVERILDLPADKIALYKAKIEAKIAAFAPDI